MSVMAKGLTKSQMGRKKPPPEMLLHSFNISGGGSMSQRVDYCQYIKNVCLTLGECQFRSFVLLGFSDISQAFSSLLLHRLDNGRLDIKLHIALV